MSVRIALMGLCALSLSACATSNFEKDWGLDCGAVEGQGCRSIADIQSSIIRPGLAPTARIYSGQTADIQYAGIPMWSPDQILKIHVGAFVDDQNNFHEESIIYSVVHRAGWTKKPEL